MVTAALQLIIGDHVPTARVPTSPVFSALYHHRALTHNLLFSPRIVLCPTPDLFKMTLQINSPHLGTEYQVGKGERVFQRDF